ncbi:disulfide bond formation protein B [Streptomyces virginiae]|uniref:disulfide bond formation protein B n=1 Tax=Streptomyces virginiae TaxID=1961 RepID=UPI002255C292|nr:disulfide bond formation protein B [Streptomyces virginiae]MCX4962847.1 disulfide bond formation protein B [Streptomyces virginiae]MCX5179197.1 disulfide bond formation protein B [Streptomyces virginiae]
MAATMHSLVPDAPPESGLLGRAQYWFACFFAFGWTCVVLGGLYHQFGLGQIPCPLCVAQRMFMLLAALGAAYIIRAALISGTVTARVYMTGWGMSLVAAIGGSFASWRQTTLHILPGAKGYGSEVFGLHLYVWAWILFQLSVVGVGVALAFAHVTADRAVPAVRPGALRTAGMCAVWFLGMVIAVNLLAVFLEEGLHWFLPDDPKRYRFFYDLGILG